MKFLLLRGPRSRRLRALFSSLSLLLAAASCSKSDPTDNESSGDTPAGDDPLVDTNDDGVPDTPASEVSNAGRGGSGAGGASTGVPESPPIECSDGESPVPPLPRSFTDYCSACHNELGAQTLRYPDLFASEKTEAEFTQVVREGGMTMPAFGPDKVSEEDLRAIIDFFANGSPGDALACGSEGPIQAPLDACSEETVEIHPLFAERTPVPAIVEIRDDGTRITRGAGRVRGRHELEETYSPYHARYFENRSYEFVIEDTVAAGGNTVKFTYLPIAPVTTFGSPTNLRAWKIYGDGNVFHLNDDMEQIELQHLEYTITSNTREDRPMQPGDLLEFEFGIFIAGQSPDDPGAIEGRTNYYTDTFRYRVGIGGLTPYSDDTSGEIGPVPAAALAGETTIPWIYAEPELYFSQMATNTQPENVQPFLEGRRLFHTHFDTGDHTESSCSEVANAFVCNPVWPEQAGKAGPLLSTTTCDTCHLNNGRGKLLDLGEPLGETSSMVFKLYEAGELGNQLQLQEGTAQVSSLEEKTVTLGDGTDVTLRRPRFEVSVNDGETPGYSARVARRLIGMGLLEAVPEQVILARSDLGDCNGDGISGRPQLVPDPVSSELRLGRFGWKAEKVSVEHQVADALEADLGVTTEIFPGEGVELDAPDFQRLTTYMRLLGMPGRRSVEDPEVILGERIFGQVGCVNCHLPATVTGHTHPLAEMRGQAIHPYTDLLLHDMGPDLADDSGTETAAEWRTPPLWGIGLLETVSGPNGYLHDGRAATLLEAILWHGGEAEATRQQVVELGAAERAALIRFLESL